MIERLKGYWDWFYFYFREFYFQVNSKRDFFRCSLYFNTRILRFLYCQNQWERRDQNSRVTIALTRLYARQEAHRACNVLLRGSPYRHSGNWERMKNSQMIQTRVFRFALEPVGSKAPAFQSDAKSSTYVRNAKLSLALTCAAQASPPPTHR